MLSMTREDVWNACELTRNLAYCDDKTKQQVASLLGVDKVQFKEDIASMQKISDYAAETTSVCLEDVIDSFFYRDARVFETTTLDGDWTIQTGNLAYANVFHNDKKVAEVDCNSEGYIVNAWGDNDVTGVEIFESFQNVIEQNGDDVYEYADVIDDANKFCRS